MPDLTDTQRTILVAAAARPNLQILLLPEHIKGGAAKRVLDAMTSRGLVAARGAESDDLVLTATDAGLRAIGTDPTPAEGNEGAKAAMSTRASRPGTKQAKLIAMLEAADSATIAEIADAMGWQHHTVRGAIAGALTKRLRLDVTSVQVEGRGRVYRIER